MVLANPNHAKSVAWKNRVFPSKIYNVIDDYSSVWSVYIDLLVFQGLQGLQGWPTARELWLMAKSVYIDLLVFLLSFV
jgi:hypothetical protein